MTHRIGLLAFVLALICSADSTAAQDTDPRPRMWFQLGVGQGSGGEADPGVGVVGHLSYERRKHIVDLRLLYLIETGEITAGAERNTALDLGLLYGRRKRFSWGYLGIAAGSSLLAFDECPDGGTESESCIAFGTPIILELARQSDLFGLSLQAYTNINSKSFLAGLSLNFQLGWMQGPPTRATNRR